MLDEKIDDGLGIIFRALGIPNLLNQTESLFDALEDRLSMNIVSDCNDVGLRMAVMVFDYLSMLYPVNTESIRDAAQRIVNKKDQGYTAKVLQDTIYALMEQSGFSFDTEEVNQKGEEAAHELQEINKAIEELKYKIQLYKNKLLPKYRNQLSTAHSELDQLDSLESENSVLESDLAEAEKEQERVFENYDPVRKAYEENLRLISELRLEYQSLEEELLRYKNEEDAELHEREKCLLEIKELRGYIDVATQEKKATYKPLIQLETELQELTTANESIKIKLDAIMQLHELLQELPDPPSSRVQRSVSLRKDKIAVCYISFEKTEIESVYFNGKPFCLENLLGGTYYFQRTPVPVQTNQGVKLLYKCTHVTDEVGQALEMSIKTLYLEK